MGDYYVYILTNKHHTVFYVGMTNNIIRRMFEHRSMKIPGFASQYRLTKLVYVESFPIAWEAIDWEKRLKRWRRSWKLEMIRRYNPTMQDLSREQEACPF